MASKKLSVFWFRRDLRIDDNTGLNAALNGDYPVLCIFIFDSNILEDLRNKEDARITFIHDQISKLNKQLNQHNSSVLVEHGDPLEVFKMLTNKYDLSEVHTNEDYEPYATERDESVGSYLKSQDIAFNLYKDQVIFHKDDVLKDDGDPYTVFTPYMKKWKATLKEKGMPKTSSFNSENFYNLKEASIPTIEELGFKRSSMEIPDSELDRELIADYDKNRDYPARHGTTKISVHLRFGTVSIRNLMKVAMDLNESWWNELIWREFYMMILWHFPIVVDRSFKTKYDQIPWRNNKEEFEKWCNGKTGYPIVDAGMRELNETGFMHNRLRMITASFLTKHLLIDWRWGEAYFAEKLLDYELSSNNGGWQWAASSGCDAVPYFRIFNPELQEKKYDPDRKYIRNWIKEIDSDDYPEPVIEHKKGRERALKIFKDALQ